jgi:hypothetical protein
VSGDAACVKTSDLIGHIQSNSAAGLMINEFSRHHKTRPLSGGGVGMKTAEGRAGLTRFWVLNRQNCTVIPLVCDSQAKPFTTLPGYIPCRKIAKKPPYVADCAL